MTGAWTDVPLLGVLAAESAHCQHGLCDVSVDLGGAMRGGDSRSLVVVARLKTRATGVTGMYVRMRRLLSTAVTRSGMTRVHAARTVKTA